MAGCLILHIGIDLSREALVDSLNSFDMFEYASVILIMVVMTVYGMTAGLGVGVLCAALTFTLQAGKHIPAIKDTLRAGSLRSSKWRNRASTKVYIIIDIIFHFTIIYNHTIF
jgi:SulP family sulfate permease